MGSLSRDVCGPERLAGAAPGPHRGPRGEGGRGGHGEAVLPVIHRHCQPHPLLHYRHAAPDRSALRPRHPPASGYARGDFDTQVSYLQEQINALVASNEALTNQVYYTGDTGGTESGSYSNLISSSS